MAAHFAERATRRSGIDFFSRRIIRLFVSFYDILSLRSARPMYRERTDFRQTDVVRDRGTRGSILAADRRTIKMTSRAAALARAKLCARRDLLIRETHLANKKIVGATTWKSQRRGARTCVHIYSVLRGTAIGRSFNRSFFTVGSQTISPPSENGTRIFNDFAF